jgi:hypothetical protein
MSANMKKLQELARTRMEDGLTKLEATSPSDSRNMGLSMAAMTLKQMEVTGMLPPEDVEKFEQRLKALFPPTQ